MGSVELVQLGETDVDFVVVDGKRRGLLPHCEGAILRFIGLPDESQRKALREAVAKLRLDAGRPAISDRTIQPPDPKEIQRLARKVKQ